jgi:hypothetical protein
VLKALKDLEEEDPPSSSGRRAGNQRTKALDFLSDALDLEYNQYAPVSPNVERS